MLFTITTPCGHCLNQKGCLFAHLLEVNFDFMATGALALAIHGEWVPERVTIDFHCPYAEQTKIALGMVNEALGEDKNG